MDDEQLPTQHRHGCVIDNLKKRAADLVAHLELLDSGRADQLDYTHVANLVDHMGLAVGVAVGCFYTDGGKAAAIGARPPIQHYRRAERARRRQ